MSDFKITDKKTTIYLGDNSLQKLNSFLKKHYEHSRKFLIVDENSLKYCYNKVIPFLKDIKNIEIIEIDKGEKNKNLTIVEQVCEVLLEFEADRSSIILNLGGGIIGDIGGFVASIYKRGIDFIQIPTTLLSQVDASVGGKVAVNVGHLKNQAGSFNMPKAVFIYPDFIKTLPKKEFASGMAEMLKHGLIADKNHWEMIHPKNIDIDLIYQSVCIKQSIVQLDPYEKNERKKLNFGHTVGHAIESYFISKKRKTLHGFAVVAGMLIESNLSYQLKLINKNTLTQITTKLDSLYSRLTIEEDEIPHLISLMKNDKKNFSNQINFTLLKNIGEAEINCQVNEDEIIKSLKAYIAVCQ
jgi:3-dehydroquinate synthase